VKTAVTKAGLRSYISRCGSDGISFGFPMGSYRICQQVSEFCDFLGWLIDNDVKIETYLEIGAAGGGTARLMSDVFLIPRIRIVDLGDHAAHVAFERNASGMVSNGSVVETFIGSSHSRPAMEFIHDATYDLVLVDGDHTQEGCTQDVAAVSGSIREGGVLAVHDVNGDPGVAAWWDGWYDPHYELAGHTHIGGNSPGMAWYVRTEPHENLK